MPKFDQSKFMQKAKRGVTQALASPDLVLVQVVSAIDEQTKMANLAAERLTEWYGLHFPELRLQEPKKYAAVALAFDRLHPDEEKLREILGPQADNVIGRAKSSNGVAFSDEDFVAVRKQAMLFLSMQTLKDELEAYQNSVAARLAPNLSYIAGPALAAKLIAQAGGLVKLASFPASTVQVIGAEKALFKHLRSGSPPPKHGLIFQFAIISTAPKHARGKLARALAAKLTIASKADAYSHNFIAEKLKQQFDARAEAILKREAERPASPPPSAPREGGFAPKPQGQSFQKQNFSKPVGDKPSFQQGGKPEFNPNSKPPFAPQSKPSFQPQSGKPRFEGNRGDSPRSEGGFKHSGNEGKPRHEGGYRPPRDSREGGERGFHGRDNRSKPPWMNKKR